MENNLLTLPALPLRGLTAFPNMLIHFDVGRIMSIKALEVAMKRNQEIFLSAQMDIKTDRPEPSDLYGIGTVCEIKQILRLQGDSIRVLVEGKKRARVVEWTGTGEPLYAKIEPIQEPVSRVSTMRQEALVRTAQEKFDTYTSYTERISKDVILTVASGGEPGYIADYIAQNISIDYTIKQELLEELNSVKRLEKVIRILSSETEILKIESGIQEKLKYNIDKNQKDYYLREQIKVIQAELGEQEASEEAQDYLGRIYDLQLSEEITDKLVKEAMRLSKMAVSSAESAVIRVYLDTCLELPWHTETKDKINLAAARKKLDRDHYGLEKVKERILEFLAVKKLAPDLKGQVICLVGPPGVGKTSIARSIAETMGKNYVRISLGGVRDEADIRGHRKTYIGAMPGRIINGLRQAGSRNCLMLLDEIDKMGNDFRGDPASAMLEVLDIEQNYAFRDHFLEVPFDLSDVLFLTTANNLSTIPRPLLDRMEVIELSSYTEVEKMEIAKRHLLPKQIEKHGLHKAQLTVTEDALYGIIQDYIREAGVRRLEQNLGKLCRKAAKQIADGEKKRVKITKENLQDYLGGPRYKKDFISKEDEIGVVNGLAWTQVGGEMLEVEINAIPGTGKTEITGNLGKVMSESAKAALTYVRSRAKALGIDPMFYKNTDIHIHFPEAAIPKDGPSAGITITTALVSALTSAPVRHEVAMTGEVTIRGRVLPIGGLREKTMAAYRAGMKTVLIPKDNVCDLQDVEKIVAENIHFIPVATMDEVLEVAVDFTRRENPPYKAPKEEIPLAPQPEETVASIRQ